MDHRQGHGMFAAVCDIASGHSMPKTRTTAIGISSFSETLLCCLLCDNSIKVILFILFIVFSLFLCCQCCLLVMILLKCNPIPSDKLSNLLEIMYPCVCARTEKPNTPHGSRSNHVQIMKLIHHNKNPLSADVSVTAHSLVENVFPQKPLKSIWNTLSSPSCNFVDS